MDSMMKNRTSETPAKTGRNEEAEVEKVVKGENRRWTQMNADVLGQFSSIVGWLPIFSGLLLIRVDLCPSVVQSSFGICPIVRNHENQVVTC